jgi:hypothetical protein
MNCDCCDDPIEGEPNECQNEECEALCCDNCFVGSSGLCTSCDPEAAE